MEQYIPKSAVVAEIERLHKEWRWYSSTEAKYRCEVYRELSEFLDTIEVKEVNLEKEIELIKGDYEQVDVAWNNDFDFIAKHFFELGLKAEKDLTWQDIKLISEIGESFMNSDESNNLSEEEYYTEILRRFKNDKGEGKTNN